MTRSAIAITLVAIIALGTGALVRQTVSATQTAPAQAGGVEARLIAALNGCIQERFKDVDERFGIRRIITLDETPHRFKPENARELTAVQNIDREKLRLVLYLAGRRVLRAQPDSSPSGVVRTLSLVKGPVNITSAYSAGVRPPAPLELLEQSRRAMLAFESSDSHEFTVGRWNFIAHPVRATDTICLKCHRAQRATIYASEVASDSSVRIGDALGVVLYGFQNAK